jgi:hypothetical protein
MFPLPPFLIPVAAIGYVIGTNVHGHTDLFGKRDLAVSRSPVFDNDQVSADINHALTTFGLDADEAKKFRAAYHVGADEFDDNEDESRKLLSDVLLKVLNAPDVEKIDSSLDVLGDKFDGLIPRDVDTTAGSKDGVRPGHVFITESTESVNDLAPRDATHVSFAEAMATWMDSMESLDAGNGPLPERLENKPKDDGSKPEKREEATDHAGPELVEPVKESDQNESPVEHPTPTESATLDPFLEKFNSTGHRAATPEDARRIFAQIQTQIQKLNGTNPQSLTDRECAKLSFLAKLNAMGLLKKPTGRQVLTIEEVFERIQSMKPKVSPELDTTPIPTAEDYTIPYKIVAVPVEQGSHSKRSVPKVPGCDCEATIEAVKDPKPEGGMTYKWFQNWEHKAVNTSCVHPCVDNAIDRFTKTIVEYQAFEARIDKEYQDYLNRPLNDTSVEKREEPTDLPEPFEAKTSKPENELPKTAHPFTYRDRYKKTQKTGQYCTCSLPKPSIWTRVMVFYQKSQRCRNFCSQSVKPFLEKEKETLAVPKEPAISSTASEQPVEESAPSAGVASVPVSQVPKDDTQPELVKSEPEVDNES